VKALYCRVVSIYFIPVGSVYQKSQNDSKRRAIKKSHGVSKMKRKILYKGRQSKKFAVS